MFELVVSKGSQVRKHSYNSTLEAFQGMANAFNYHVSHREIVSLELKDKSDNRPVFNLNTKEKING